MKRHRLHPKYVLCFSAALAGSVVQGLAQSPHVIPPGVPEPGLVIWGSVVNVNNPAQPIAISSVAWSVSDSTNAFIYDAESKPPTRIVQQNGQSYYVVEVPFDTRTFGSVQLTNPSTVGIQSFELKAVSPPAYTLMPVINGLFASVRAIDGAPAAGTNVPVTGFTSAIRGRVIRVDLAAKPLVESYEDWAFRIWGSIGDPRAHPLKDPDQDGFNNQKEFLAGTDPTNPSSLLRILTLGFNAQQDQVTVLWQSVSNRNYRVETASDPDGPWLEAGSTVPGAGGSEQTVTSLPLRPMDPKAFYRVRLVP